MKSDTIDTLLQNNLHEKMKQIQATEEQIV